MGRRLEYEVKTSVRLNMSNPQHVKINDVIQNLDPKIFKSKNQFIDVYKRQPCRLYHFQIQILSIWQLI